MRLTILAVTACLCVSGFSADKVTATVSPPPAPPSPVGTRDVSINKAGQSVGDFATLRDLTLLVRAYLKSCDSEKCPVAGAFSLSHSIRANQ